MKRIIHIILFFLLILFLDLTHICSADAGNNSNNYIVSMIEAQTIHWSFDFPEDIAPETITWTFGGKPLDQWKKFKDWQYEGEPFISVSDLLVEHGIAEAEISFQPVYDESWMLVQFPAYLDMIGTYDLAANSGDTVITEIPITLLPYESYVSYDMLAETVSEITSAANTMNDRYIFTASIGKSVEGRDILMSIVAKDEATVRNYEEYLLPEMLNDPSVLQTKIREGELSDYTLPIFISSVHPNEAPNTAATLQLFRILSLEESVPFETDNAESAFQLNIDELLNDLFFILVYTSNPDGLAYGSRINAAGLDLNRDFSYQTQPETQALAAQIAHWTPLTYLDLHGFDEGFLIEPAMPPHDPNLELDLLMNNLLEQGRAMGNTAIANTAYTDYYIPYEEYLKSRQDPNYVRKGAETSLTWDDLSPNYAASFAVHHGALGFTMEIPAFEEESVKALIYACLGGVEHIREHKTDLFLNQLEIFRRGVENIDDSAVDSYLVDAQDQIIGRMRGENENFFPEYYILPVDSPLQKNPYEAYQMAAYFLRNGIKVERLHSDVMKDGIVFPAGTLIIPLHQAKRSLVNSLFFDGIDISDYPAASDAFVQRFQTLRGFDLYVSREKDAFENQMETVSEIQKPGNAIPAEEGFLLLHNTGSDAIRAVNALLNTGKTVTMIAEGEYTGNFMISAEDFAPLAADYCVELEAFDENPEGLLLRPITAAAYGETAFLLKSLGFSATDNTDEADVLINTWDPAEAIADGVPYIAFGNYGMMNLIDILDGFSYDAPDWEQYEGLFSVQVSQDSPITASFAPEELFYTISGAYITEIPDGAKILAKYSSDDHFFQAGWWPGHEKAQGQILAFEYTDTDSKIVVFANDLTANAHSQYQTGMLVNALYSLTGD